MTFGYLSPKLFLSISCRCGSLRHMFDVGKGGGGIKYTTLVLFFGCLLHAGMTPWFGTNMGWVGSEVSNIIYLMMMLMLMIDNNDDADVIVCVCG